VVDSLDQPHSVRAKLSSKQSISYIVKKPVVPLIWTALKLSVPGSTLTVTYHGWPALARGGALR
jgi:hypothetical protein